MNGGYFESGGDQGECTACGRSGRLRPYPGSVRDQICEPCRRRDWWIVTLFVLLMLVLLVLAAVAIAT
jgi:hypothetical protein